jgi:hypothetical protein
MLNSTDENGAPLPAGKIRKCWAFTAGYIYSEASMARFEHAIETCNVSKDRRNHILVSAAVLFYEVIQAYPFQD